MWGFLLTSSVTTSPQFLRDPHRIGCALRPLHVHCLVVLALEYDKLLFACCKDSSNTECRRIIIYKIHQRITQFKVHSNLHVKTYSSTIITWQFLDCQSIRLEFRIYTLPFDKYRDNPFLLLCRLGLRS